MLLCIPRAGGPADEEIEAMTHVPGSQPVYQPRGQRAGPPAVQRPPNNPVYAPRDVPPAPRADRPPRGPLRRAEPADQPPVEADSTRHSRPALLRAGRATDQCQQIIMAQIHDIDALQSMTQKARGVGSVRVIVAGPAGLESVLLDDFVEFRQLVEVLNEVARRARMAEQQRNNTQHMNFAGGVILAAAQAPQVDRRPEAPAVAASPDPIAQLERLAKLRDRRRRLR